MSFPAALMMSMSVEDLRNNVDSGNNCILAGFYLRFSDQFGIHKPVGRDVHSAGKIFFKCKSDDVQLFCNHDSFFRFAYFTANNFEPNPVNATRTFSESKSPDFAVTVPTPNSACSTTSPMRNSTPFEECAERAKPGLRSTGAEVRGFSSLS